jgi:hypothetical protein
MSLGFFRVLNKFLKSLHSNSKHEHEDIEVLTALTTRSKALRVITLRSSETARRFGGAYSFSFHDRRVSQGTNQGKETPSSDWQIVSS